MTSLTISLLHVERFFLEKRENPFFSRGRFHQRSTQSKTPWAAAIWPARRLSTL
jgi:hypothetical protein